jgi:hypothetical protein
MLPMLMSDFFGRAHPTQTAASVGRGNRNMQDHLQRLLVAGLVLRLWDNATPGHMVIRFLMVGIVQ